jgi:hypothetical protein
MRVKKYREKKHNYGKKCDVLVLQNILSKDVQYSSQQVLVYRTLQDGVLIKNMFAQRNNNT